MQIQKSQQVVGFLPYKPTSSVTVDLFGGATHPCAEIIGQSFTLAFIQGALRFKSLKHPRRGRLDKSSLIFFSVVDLLCAGTFGIFHLRPLNGARLIIPQGGFEPPQADPESAVLPLHNRGM